MNCIECGKALTTGRKFCSKACNNRFTKRRYEYIENCKQCNKPMKRRTDAMYNTPYCISCVGVHRTPVDFSGENNPMWLGGHSSWQEGKFGKDKDGLSWKTQRYLCWERDNYGCMKCGKQKTTRNPDVHHIVPYRVSKSHSLDNLICLCKKCHKEEDNRLM